MCNGHAPCGPLEAEDAEGCHGRAVDAHSMQLTKDGFQQRYASCPARGEGSHMCIAMHYVEPEEARAAMVGSMMLSPRSPKRATITPGVVLSPR